MDIQTHSSRRLGERAVTWLMMTLGCAPVVILYAAGASAADTARLWITTLGLYAFAVSVGFFSGIFVPRHRVRAGLVGLLSIIIAFALLDAIHFFLPWWSVGFAALLLAAWFVGLKASSSAPGQEFPPAIWMALAILHAFAAMLTRLQSMENLPGHVRLMLNITAPAYFLLMAVRMNEFTLASGAASRKTGSASPAMRRRNIFLVLGAAAVTVGIANIGQIGRAAKQAFNYIVIGILWLVSKLPLGGNAAESGGEAGGGMDLSGLGEATEPSLFAQIMEKVFFVVAIIIAAALLCLLLWQIGRLAMRLFRRIAARFAKLASELNQGYTDESERILDWDELTRSARGRLRSIIPRRERLPKWSELDNRARVRLAVRILLRNKQDLPESLTISHALSRGELKAAGADASALAMAYDKARYSGGDVGDDEARNAKVAFERGGR